MEEKDIEVGLSEDEGSPPTAAPPLRGSVSEMVFSQPQARLPAETGATLTKQHSDPLKHRKEAKETPTAPPVLFRQFPSLRALSFKVYSPVVETFYCQICMENVAVSEACFFTGNGICGHRFCKDCLTTYVSGRIVEGQTRHPCPCIGMTVDGGFCETEATRDDIAQIVTEDVLAKYDRFVTMKADQNHRDCPNCGTMFIGNPRSPEMVCPSCSTKFCFFHSNAHPGQTCREYARRTRQDERRSQSTIVQISKACPSCRTRVEKNGGCNHMTCSCGCEWCWLCGRRMGSNHFAAWNLFGCPGSQFANLNSNWLLYPYKLLVLIGALFFGVFIVVTSPLIAYAYFRRDDDWDDSIEFAAKWTLLPLMYFLVLVLYAVVYVPIALIIVVPILSINKKVTTGSWPGDPWGPIALSFEFEN